MADPANEAAIREQAYAFWEEDGRPEGRETEHWMRATVAVAEKRQMDTLSAPAPEGGKKRDAAAGKKAAPTKSEAGKKRKTK